MIHEDDEIFNNSLENLNLKQEQTVMAEEEDPLKIISEIIPDFEFAPEPEPVKYIPDPEPVKEEFETEGFIDDPYAGYIIDDETGEVISDGSEDDNDVEGEVLSLTDKDIKEASLQAMLEQKQLRKDIKQVNEVIGTKVTEMLINHLNLTDQIRENIELGNFNPASIKAYTEMINAVNSTVKTVNDTYNNRSKVLDEELFEAGGYEPEIEEEEEYYIFEGGSSIDDLIKPDNENLTNEESIKLLEESIQETENELNTLKDKHEKNNE